MRQSATVAVGAVPLDRGRARRQERPELISTGNPGLIITPGRIRRSRQSGTALRIASRRSGHFRRVDVDQPDPFAVAETNSISIMDRSDADSCCGGKDQWHAAAGNRSARPSRHEISVTAGTSSRAKRSAPVAALSPSRESHSMRSTSTLPRAFPIQRNTGHFPSRCPSHHRSRCSGNARTRPGVRNCTWFSTHVDRCPASLTAPSGGGQKQAGDRARRGHGSRPSDRLQAITCRADYPGNRLRCRKPSTLAFRVSATGRPLVMLNI